MEEVDEEELEEKETISDLVADFLLAPCRIIYSYMYFFSCVISFPHPSYFLSVILKYMC